MGRRTFGLAAFTVAAATILITGLATIGGAHAQIATCLGDCDGDDVVDAAEVAGAVRAIFDETTVVTCPTYDLDDSGRVTAADIVAMVNRVASGCPGGEFAFDKIALAVFPGAEETLNVTAEDENGQPVAWSAVASDPSIVSVSKTEHAIEVTGIDLGATAIIVTTQSGRRGKVPVRVYDSTVLDAGEILIRYVDDFVCQSVLTAAGADASFYRPAAPEGWHALGSFGAAVPTCRNIDGQQWMMVVKEDLVTSFDESISGDLPGGGPAFPPRALAFAVGNNQVRGSIGGDDQFDSFSFTLEQGAYLNGVVLKDFAGTFGEVRFFAGTDTGAPPPAFLGEALMSTGQIGANYLDLLDLDLGPGVYSISLAASAPQQYAFSLTIGTDPSTRSTAPLVAPTSWRETYRFPRILPTLCEAFWSPVCPQGYVAMGTVYQQGVALNCDAVSPPMPDEAVCVREDLTVPGVAADDPIWSDQAYRTEAPENRNYETTTAFLETGAFAAAGEPVANVLAVELPPLIDVESPAPFPRLTSFRQPPEFSEPAQARALLIPFTTLLNGKDKYAEKPACSENEGCTIGWMLENSPFVRMERAQRWHRELWNYNSSGTPIEQTRTFRNGLTHEQSDSISAKAGVSVTTESGVSFLGTGGKVSATVSFEFGYTSQRSVSEFEEVDTDLSIVALPGKAAAAWRGQSTIVVKLHHPQREAGFNSGFEELVRLEMYDSGISANDDYPDSHGQ